MELPVTEQRNSITTNIDVSSPVDMVRLLEKCDAEIFHSWGNYADQNIFSAAILDAIVRVQEHVKTVLLDPTQSSVVIAGCGTSGRLAFITARTMNIMLRKVGCKEPCFSYIMAGSDKALFNSEELYEDDPLLGADLLKKRTAGKKRVVYIGITCGLSAPFVAGQLEYCLKNLDKYIPVLLGFNPVVLARKTKIEKWGGKSFLDVIDSYLPMVSEGKAFIINPIVGPEAICGSSRMKGGSATKIILETIFISAYYQAFPPTSLLKEVNAVELIGCYQEVCQDMYSQAEKIAQVIELAGYSLKTNGHIYYLGWDSLGIMGLIDASECPPTYGANPNDIRGFLLGGYATLENREGDLINNGELFDISLTHFNKDISTSLQENDLVICLTKDPSTNISMLSHFPRCKMVQVNFSWGTEVTLQLDFGDLSLNFQISSEKMEVLMGREQAKEWSQVFIELATKLFLNAVSTCAHILKGKVFQNIMIDMKTSNNKLFHRSLGIISEFSGLSTSEATKYLLRSLYDTDELTPEQLAASTGTHIEMAMGKEKIVPIALLASVKKCSISEARQALAAQSVVRTVVSETINPISS